MPNYSEHTVVPKHGLPPLLVPTSTLSSLVGFRSVYSYPDETVAWIKANGSMAGLVASKQPVATDRLLIDIDDDPESGKLFAAFFLDAGITHSIWDSGGRSMHIHVECLPKQDWRIPFSQRKWMEELGKALGAKADLSIYHAAGLYRLPRTIHSKTGKQKVAVSSTYGSPLDYELLDSTVTLAPSTDKEALAVVWRLLLTQLDAGGRQMHVFKITSNASALGWSAPTILEHLEAWNSWNPHPLTQEQVETKMYQSLGGSHRYGK